MEPPSRVLEIPWTLKSLYPALPNSIRNHPGPCQILVVPKKPVKKTTKPLMPVKDDVRQVTPSKAFESIHAPTSGATREATLHTALPALKANEPTVSSIEMPPPETQHKRMSTVESSKESIFKMVPTTTNMSSYNLFSKKN